jgi:hypothetical protein
MDLHLPETVHGSQNERFPGQWIGIGDLKSWPPQSNGPKGENPWLMGHFKQRSETLLSLRLQ